MHSLNAVPAYQFSQPAPTLFPVEAQLSKEAGFACPVSCTPRLWRVAQPTILLERAGQSLTGRLWDLLSLLRFALKAKLQERTEFSEFLYPCFLMEEKQGKRGSFIPSRPTPYTIKATIEDHSDGRPSITLDLDD